MNIQEVLEKQGADLMKAELRRILQYDINRFAEIKAEDANDYADVLYMTLESIAKILNKYNIVDFGPLKPAPEFDLESLLEETKDMIEERRAIEGPTEWL